MALDGQEFAYPDSSTSPSSPSAANAETERLILAQPDAAAALGTRCARGAWASRLAVAAGVVGLGSCAVLMHQFRNTAIMMDKFLKPFRLYDSGQPGCLPMPARSDQYDGIEDQRPVQVIEEGGKANIFVIGDWGATLPDHITFSGGGSDNYAQFSVGNVMKDRAKWAKPQYVLNVGDNFYVEGLQHSCNAPPNDNQGVTTAAFTSGWQGIYGDVANIPWLSVLGNHDYGGWRFDKGWPQQIGYSFINYNWIMPARYFMKRIAHAGFNADYFMIDTNAWDAHDIGEPGENADHNICSRHNFGGAGTCAANGGMNNIGECKAWFWNTYAVQKQWLEEKLKASDANWKIVVTHFPCGYDSAYWKDMKMKYGLDLMLTGHRHQQELWHPHSTSKYVQSFMQTSQWDGNAPTCVVTGGGGGIISQKFPYADYGHDLLWYGFFHLTMHKDWLQIELVDTDGVVKGNTTIYPRGSQGYEVAKNVKLTMQGICESYCGDTNNGWSKVCSWGYAPWMSCAACPGCHTTPPPPATVPPPAPAPAPQATEVAEVTE